MSDSNSASAILFSGGQLFSDSTHSSAQVPGVSQKEVLCECLVEASFIPILLNAMSHPCRYCPVLLGYTMSSTFALRPILQLIELSEGSFGDSPSLRDRLEI